MHLFFYNNVEFARKSVLLYPNIRLLERDGWKKKEMDKRIYPSRAIVDSL